MPLNFENLEVWKECRKLRIDISKLVKGFPELEKYRLCDQLIRASRSTTANIAEGHGRYHFQENIQFCRHSRGSLDEILDHLICANDENYIDEKLLGEYRVKINLCHKLLNGYISYLQQQKDYYNNKPNK